MRLNKFLATAGIASRRKADAYISEGRVRINGSVVTDFSYRVQPSDRVEVDGQPVEQPQEHHTIVLFKPRGVTTTMDDPHAEQPVSDILPAAYKHLRPAGRLDKDSEGLLVFSSDGDFIQQLMHPSYEKEKEYYVECERAVSDRALEQLEQGIELEEGVTKPARVVRIAENAFNITLTQGWKRQIRRMVKKTGNHVTLLRRIRIGTLSMNSPQLHGMQPGEVREVNKEDIL